MPVDFELSSRAVSKIWDWKMLPISFYTLRAAQTCAFQAASKFS